VTSLYLRPLAQLTPELKLTTSRGALFQGDSLDLLRHILDDSINCIFADPPFNLGKSYAAGVSDELPESDYVNWTHRWLSECVRVLKPGGSLFIYHMPKRLIMISSYLNNLETLDFKSWIAIKMKNGFPIRGRFHPAHYGLIYYTKKGAKATFNLVRTPSPTCRHCGELIRDYGGYRKKYPTDDNNVPLIRLADFWDDVSPNIHRKSRPNMINELPQEVPYRAILTATDPGDVVLDPFAGGGSSLEIAEANGRYWIGCEKGPTNTAEERLVAAGSKRKNLPQKVEAVFKSDALKTDEPPTMRAKRVKSQASLS